MRIRLIGCMAVLTFLTGCMGHHSKNIASELVPRPSRVTADIQKGIERHIDEQTRLGKGTFNLPFNDKELRMKLVRVHTEYLAKLGPESHFACVDLADESGDVYDVDFFLAGKSDNMKVTETTIHKINGQPYYMWDQKEDGTWQRIPVDKASEGHFGVLRGEDSFEFYYRAKIPDMKTPARMWIPMPESDQFQNVMVKNMKIPGKQKKVKDSAHGNDVLFVELGPEQSGQWLEITYDVKRLEKSIYPMSASEAKKYLKPEKLVPINKQFKDIAQKVTKGKKTDLIRARALYDHTIDQMRYIKNGKGWGKGDAVYACDIRTGNCTDFHAYFIALARAADIPARFAIGAGIPSHRDEGGVSGYHCWAEFYADGNWWPVDISEADKYSSLATYYFGHHPANRIEFSRGRDLIVDPMPASGPINFLAYPLVEVDGKPVRTKVEFSFKRSSKI